MKALHVLFVGLIAGLLPLAAQAFEAEFDAPPARAIAIGEITIGEALAAKTAEYGERDVAQLADELRGVLEREFRRTGRLAEPTQAGARLMVVIEDASPNRPTAQQLTRSPQPLDHRTLMVGGARLSATLVDADGTATGRFEDQWQTRPDYRRSADAVTWTDARRAFDRFATRVADAVAAQGG